MNPRSIPLAFGFSIALGLFQPAVAATSYRPGVAFVRIEQTPRLYLQVGVSLAGMEARLDEALRSANKGGTKISVTGLSVAAQDASNSVLQISFSAVVRVSGIKANCHRIVLSFAIPAQPVLNGPSALRLEERDRVVNCDYSNDLAKTFLPNLDAFLNNTITKQFLQINSEIASGISKSVTGNPDLANAFQKTIVAGSICVQEGAPHFCVTVLPAPGVIENVFSTVIAAAPKPIGQPVDEAGLQAMISATAPLLPRKPSTRIAGYKFPSSTNAKGEFDDGDLAISGGLICRGGDPEGCLLVQSSQGKDGAFWRSPDRVDLPPPDPKSASFSGDQFKGVALMLSVTRDSEALGKWLSFIRGTRTLLPDGRAGSAIAFRSCVADPGFVCVLSSEEWVLLGLLVNALGLPADAIPAEARGSPYPYKWGPEFLEWQAISTEVGYQLHLVGVQILLLRDLGVSDPALTRAAAILASRQPMNPFYLYLHLGRDKAVSDKVLQQCDATSLAPLKARLSWVWQHDSMKKRWLDDPMVWDCQFAAHLLTSSNEIRRPSRTLPLRADTIQ